MPKAILGTVGAQCPREYVSFTWTHLFVYKDLVLSIALKASLLFLHYLCKHWNLKSLAIEVWLTYSEHMKFSEYNHFFNFIMFLIVH